MKKVMIIGAGASGMMAAITAGRAGAEVILLEHNDRIGKKILSTGNGRCNFTNTAQEPQFYRSEELFFGWGIVEQFTALDTIRFFHELGIYSKNRNGYMYPHSDQASAVLHTLQAEISRLGIVPVLQVQVGKIKYGPLGFTVQTNRGAFHSDRLILATGSQAAPVTGSDGSGYDFARALGHTIVPVVPALVQLRCKQSFYRHLAGIRVNGKVSVYVDGDLKGHDTGEIQLTEYGISGIPVFQVSRYAAKGLFEKRPVYCVLDFMPDFSEAQLVDFLKKRVQFLDYRMMGDFFIGLFHKQLASVLLKLTNIDQNKQADSLGEADILRLAKQIKEFQTEISGVNPFEKAQVCAGGVSTREVDHKTLESRLVKGLYFAGELLDVDGICGGYNLQWAWSSGYVTGRESSLRE